MLYKTTTTEFKERRIKYIHDLQERICSALSEEDGKKKFATDAWERADGKGGGGITRTFENGNVIEKGGVNTCLLYTSPSPRDRQKSRMPSSA